MLDKDIAAYFGVTTSNLNKAMKRNIKRFPQNFCFQLTSEECSRFQIGILNGSRGSNIKYLPYVYTEQGVAMLTSSLHTDRAIEASIQIIEAFVEMTHYLKQNRQLLPNDELQSLQLKHLNGEPFKADVAYQSIYSKAKKSIIMIDDYLGVKTLNHLAQAKQGVTITIISDNKGSHPLKLSEFNDFLTEYPTKQILR